MQKTEKKISVNDLEYYIPASTPPEVAAYGSKIDQLGVGKAGKLGALILRLEREEQTGKTSVKDQYSKVPLFTQRALYLEEALPSMAYMYIISPSGGILQGDRYRMDITLTNHASAHITTQGATRIYRMEKNYATQIVNFNVDEGCYFEYIPDQVIPFRDSRFYQEVNLHVHDNATLLYSEIITPGRVESGGERFAYDICYMKVIARNQANNLRFIDVAILEPKKRNMKLFGILSGYEVVGSMYVLTNKKVQEINSEVNANLKAFGNVYAGATILPGNSGVMVRMLGQTANDLRAAIFEVVRTVRKILLDAPFSGIRKG